MIALSAHREIMRDHAWKESVIGPYEPTRRGYGAWQSPSKWSCVRRYKARQRGIEPPLEYVSLDEALEALS